ncbi:hypothetical protein [Nocardioides sp. GY 10127]|uniref:hypothetical protein n=1 Tax=Nocardioides sp. GY 10127 TaxID=2569762 RepID=UPI0010A90A8B|nr:hypothetical protein [Nocardioides sp. GY 10127]TIC83946.1 hypothetical protein E8D37_03770 [Nocardioides sp. GY 10127]
MSPRLERIPRLGATREEGGHFGDLPRQLVDRGTTAPRQAIQALLAFGHRPQQAVAVRNDDGSEWLLAALVAGGLVEVHADAREAWSFDTSGVPFGARVRASWHPIDTIRAVHFTLPELEDGDDGTAPLRGTWVIHLAGGNTLQLDAPDDEQDNGASVEVFAQAVTVARSR